MSVELWLGSKLINKPKNKHLTLARSVKVVELRPWSKWTANKDKELNVNKPCMTSRKTAFRFLKAFFFSYLHPFVI